MPDRAFIAEVRRLLAVHYGTPATGEAEVETRGPAKGPDRRQAPKRSPRPADSSKIADQKDLEPETKAPRPRQTRRVST